MSETAPEKSEMSELAFASEAMRTRIAPVGSAPYVESRIRRAARDLRWSFSRTRDVWYADPRVSLKPRELRDIETVAGIVENVAALLSGPSEQPGGWFGRVLGDLAEIGYDAEWHCIRAGTVGLPQERDRVWIVAYPNEVGRQAPILETPLPNQAGAFRGWEQVELYGTRGGNARWFPKSRTWRVGDGAPSELDVARTEVIGNAVVPQIPELIGNAILESLAA